MSLLTAALLGVALQQWDAGDPSPDEQLVLEIINRARAAPTAEGTRLQSFSPIGLPGGDIKEGLDNPGSVGPRPPLAMNKNLLATSRAHSKDMYTRDYFDHDTKSPPTQTWVQRINAGGYSGALGENIATSSSGTAAFLEDFLMVDWYFNAGVPTGVDHRGHRANLLDVDNAGSPYREVGVGYHLGAAPNGMGFKDFITQDFGRNGNGPFVLGVVYNDANGNGVYDIGEGMKGVTVRVSSAPGVFAVTTLSGGFAFPATTNSGAITIEFTGGQFGLTVVSKPVTPGFSGENVKVDCKLADASLPDTDNDHLPDGWEMAMFGNLTQTGGDDPDHDLATNLAEFNAGSDPTKPSSVPTGGGPGGGGSLTDSGGGGGGCGLCGLEVLLALSLWRFRRRS